MRVRPLIAFALIVIVCAGYGCSRFRRPAGVSDERFPANIGSYKLDMIRAETDKTYFNDKDKGQPAYKAAMSNYVNGSDEFFYTISTHQTAESAVNEQGKIADGGKRTCFAKFSLQTLAGKNAGSLTVCRKTEPDAAAMKKTSGGYDYSVAFNIGNINHSVYGGVSQSKDPADKLVSFVKNLPVTSQLNLKALDVFTSGMADKAITAEKIAAISPPSKLVSQPYLNGKTVVVVKGVPIEGVETDFYISDGSKRALTMDEVGSIVKIACSKGPRIGEYELKEKGLKVPAFGSVCKIDIIDQSKSAVIFSKTFTNNVLLDYAMVDTDSSGKVKESDKEYLVPAPTTEMKKFIDSLPPGGK